MGLVNPLNLKQWVKDNRHLLKPPVGNKCVWENEDFIIMVVGGPQRPQGLPRQRNQRVLLPESKATSFLGSSIHKPKSPRKSLSVRGRFISCRPRFPTARADPPTPLGSLLK